MGSNTRISHAGTAFRYLRGRLNVADEVLSVMEAAALRRPKRPTRSPYRRTACLPES